MGDLPLSGKKLCIKNIQPFSPCSKQTYSCIAHSIECKITTFLTTNAFINTLNKLQCLLCDHYEKKLGDCLILFALTFNFLWDHQISNTTIFGSLNQARPDYASPLRLNPLDTDSFRHFRHNCQGNTSCSGRIIVCVVSSSVESAFASAKPSWHNAHSRVDLLFTFSANSETKL